MYFPPLINTGWSIFVERECFTHSDKSYFNGFFDDEEEAKKYFKNMEKSKFFPASMVVKITAEEVQ